MTDELKQPQPHLEGVLIAEAVAFWCVVVGFSLVGAAGLLYYLGAA